MSDDNGVQNARRLLEITEEMLRLARTGDWEGLARRSADQERLSRTLFERPVPSEAAAMVAACVGRVLELEQEIIGLATGYRVRTAQGT